MQQQVNSLKNQLREDAQVWERDIVKVTVHETVDSIEGTLINVFSEVKQLQDATKGLIKWSERLAEVIQTVCDKVTKNSRKIYTMN